jgi:hypothetical protein
VIRQSCELASVYNTHSMRHCLTCTPDQMMTNNQSTKLVTVSHATRIGMLRTDVEAPKLEVSTPLIAI